MLNIWFYNLKDGKILGFKVLGHCGYAENGKDIVCSAVSSAVYMVINTITEILKVNLNVLSVDDGNMDIRIDENDECLCRVLFNGLKLHLLSLEEMYPKNIKVNYMEV